MVWGQICAAGVGSVYDFGVDLYGSCVVLCLISGVGAAVRSERQGGVEEGIQEEAEKRAA